MTPRYKFHAGAVLKCRQLPTINARLHHTAIPKQIACDQFGDSAGGCFDYGIVLEREYPLHNFAHRRVIITSIKGGSPQCDRWATAGGRRSAWWPHP